MQTISTKLYNYLWIHFNLEQLWIFQKKLSHLCISSQPSTRQLWLRDYTNVLTPVVHDQPSRPATGQPHSRTCGSSRHHVWSLLYSLVIMPRLSLVMNRSAAQQANLASQLSDASFLCCPRDKVTDHVLRRSLKRHINRCAAWTYTTVVQSTSVVDTLSKCSRQQSSAVVNTSRRERHSGQRVWGTFRSRQQLPWPPRDRQQTMEDVQQPPGIASSHLGLPAAVGRATWAVVGRVGCCTICYSGQQLSEVESFCVRRLIFLFADLYLTCFVLYNYVLILYYILC